MKNKVFSLLAGRPERVKPPEDLFLSSPFEWGRGGGLKRDEEII